ncbi:hypothetical protein ACWOKP_002129 [Vibrio parahaemolyticus]
MSVVCWFGLGACDEEIPDVAWALRSDGFPLGYVCCFAGLVWFGLGACGE